VKSHWAGLIEFFVVLAFALCWAVLELACLRLDRQKAERERAAREPRAD
jgi:hypothetical protein